MPNAIAACAPRLKDNPEARPYLDTISKLSFVEPLVERRLPFEWAPTRMISDDPAKGLGRAAPETLHFSKLTDMLGEPSRMLGLLPGLPIDWML